MKALHSFTVRPQLPERLAGLDALAANLRWSWDRRTRQLFRSINPIVWDEGGHDPRRVLAETSPERLTELSTDADFCADLDAAAASLQTYLSEPRWYQQTVSPDPLDGGVVAYFSPEFGIAEAVPQYSGGLGVLAGDHLKSASDLGVPLIGIGLFYRHGYFRQSLSIDGWQQERFPDLDPFAMSLNLCDGVRVELDLAGRRLVAQVWAARVGRTPLYLLDTDLPDNDEDLQLVTDRLYGGDVEHRLRQEILLGIGGVRALEALGIDARVFHTNEGHAGFLGLERIRNLIQRDGLTLDEAIQAVRAGSVFTTHTPVPAGIDQFPRELIEQYFPSWREACGVSPDDMMRLGHRPDSEPDDRFNMAVMGMHLAERRNGVSALHGQVSRGMFADLWPGVPEDETPVGHITNGVHGETWVGRELATLFEDHIGSDWEWCAPEAWDAVAGIGDEDLWQAHRAAKERLVEHVRDRLRSSGLAVGRSPSELEWIDTAFDPDALTICFARRFATYKRAALLLRQPERLAALVTDPDRPVQFIFAGKAHPADDAGKELIRQVVSFASDASVRHRFAFVEDYDMWLARILVQGADVWLNTPVKPMEASGTSGMKAVMNSALHCSILDGWWAECFDDGWTPDGPGVANGWAISSADGLEDDERRNEVEAAGLFDLIERQLVPLYHPDGGAVGAPSPAWVERQRVSLRTLGPFVSAHRMVRDYTERLYLPAARHSAELNDADHVGARQLAAYTARLDALWHSVHVDRVDVSDSIADLGDTRGVTAVVALGELDVSEVEVQLVIGRVGQSGELEDTQTVPMVGGESIDSEGHRRFAALALLDRAGRLGVTVRVVPAHPLVADPAELGHVAWAG
ncbi:MAG: glycosyltransferase family 1 protein [Actinobacteria bacterium]|nr:glycosyltransferase family 1 protein [Actinomycetota bacterium]